MVPESVKAGDHVGFAGRCLESVAIQLGTYTIPFFGLSHVGLLAHDKNGELLFWESTDEGACGVQAHPFAEVVEKYNGKVWLYPLYRPLYEYEGIRLTEFVEEYEGSPYDRIGAIRSGGLLLALIHGILRQQDLTSLFCSEFIAAADAYLGLFPTTNASRWNPRKLMSRLRRDGIVHKPVRLK